MKSRMTMVFAACWLIVSTAQAGPDDYVRSPIVTQGEREIDVKTGTQRYRDGVVESAQSLGYGMTVRPGWFAEIYGKYARASGEALAFDAIELENRFQLTERGRYPVELGWLLEIERPRDRSEGYELTYGPLIQAEWGRIQGNFNVLWQQHVRATQAFDTELHLQGQLKIRQSRALEWGLQAFSNLGPWQHWRPAKEQEFKWGPALFGKFNAAAGSAVVWNAAFLMGSGSATAARTLRLQVEYEF